MKSQSLLNEECSEIKKEHLEIRAILSEIENLFNRDGDINYLDILSKFNALNKFWNEHELKEERLFKGEFPVETMFLKQHKELHGHWHVLNNVDPLGKEEDLKVVIDTDGKMLIEKFRRHMEQEDKFFDNIIT